MKGDSENHFEGPIIPFGAMVEYHPISAKDQARLRQFAEKVVHGICLGFVLFAGRIWKDLDASEVHPRRLKTKEIITPQNARTANLSGRDHGSPRIHSNAGTTCNE